MSKVLIATEKPFAAPAVAGIKQILTEAGFEVVLLEKYTTKAELFAAVADVEAIIIRSDIIDAEVFDAAKQLKIVVRAGAGYDNVDLESATAHGVCVMNTPGVINEPELIALLKEREDLRYFADIRPGAHEEFEAAAGDRYFSTPKKMGAQTSEANTNAGLAAARQIVGFIKEGNERFRLNK